MSHVFHQSGGSNVHAEPVRPLPIRLLPFAEIMGWNCQDSRDEIAAGYTLSIEWLAASCSLPLRASLALDVFTRHPNDATTHSVLTA